MNQSYQSYENKMCDNSDMSEEDRIMSALEKGDGEHYGF